MKRIFLMLAVFTAFATLPFGAFAQADAAAASAATASAPAVSADSALQAFSKKWTEKEKFTVSWHYAQFGYSFTAYPKKGEFVFNSVEYCERGVHKAYFFTHNGKFMVKVIRENHGCTPMLMIFDPITGEGKAGEGEVENYSPLPGRRLRLME